MNGGVGVCVYVCTQEYCVHERPESCGTGSGVDLGE